MPITIGFEALFSYELRTWAPERVEAMRVPLKGGIVAAGAEPEVVSSLAHSVVAEVLGMVRTLEATAIGTDVGTPPGPGGVAVPEAVKRTDPGAWTPDRR